MEIRGWGGAGRAKAFPTLMLNVGVFSNFHGREVKRISFLKA